MINQNQIPENYVNRQMDDAFHTVGALFSRESELVTVAPNDKVEDALRIMLNNRFSQIPVVGEGECRGIVSFHSISRRLLGLTGQQLALDALKVMDVMATPHYISSTDTIDDLYARIETHEALLVGSSSDLEAVITPFDLLKRLTEIAGPFILAQEIELALRQFIRLAVPKDELEEYIERALYRDRPSEEAPSPGDYDLEELTFEEIERIVTNGDNFRVIGPHLGERIVVRSRLLNIRSIRNDIMHHKSLKTSIEHYDDLVDTRNFLLERIRLMQRFDR